ncbi:hypothetical protein [Herbaspirillum rubrisubalbicans]|uniref:hypothetical protein n=1 Tax=Herbaspirillum rubrisubalbicans TaxID=80842 RepID=UPI00073A4317|nr:hypothetical protein [Herbaspirillum rubrisubalbicans]
MLRGNSYTAGKLMYQQFKKFLSEKIADFRRMVRQARGQVELEELQSSAWVVAAELGEKRKSGIDFSNKQDQDWILATVYNQSVRASKSVKYAVSIDQPTAWGDDDLPSLADTLPAPENSDPLTALLHLERLEEIANTNDLSLAATFSQAAAYAISLEKFENVNSLSTFLAISGPTLVQRISRAAASLKVQDSIFDGIERIPRSFIPKRGSVKLSKSQLPSIDAQLAFAFPGFS